MSCHPSQKLVIAFVGLSLITACAPKDKTENKEKDRKIPDAARATPADGEGARTEPAALRPLTQQVIDQEFNAGIRGWGPQAKSYFESALRTTVGEFSLPLASENISEFVTQLEVTFLSSVNQQREAFRFTPVDHLEINSSADRLADLYAETPSVHSRSAALTLGLAIHEKSELTNVCNESVNWVVQFDESGTRVGVAKKTESTWELTLVGSAGLGIPSETVRLDEETQDIQLVFLSDWIQSQVAQPVNPDLSIQATRTCLGLVDAPITDIPPETIEPTLNPSLFSQIDFSIHGGGALDVRFLRSEAGIFSFIKGNCGYEIPDYTKPSTEVTDSALAQALEKLFTGQITVQKNEPNPLPTGTFRAVTTTDPQGALQEYANPSLSNVGGGSELDTIFAFASQACTQP